MYGQKKRITMIINTIPEPLARDNNIASMQKYKGTDV